MMLSEYTAKSLTHTSNRIPFSTYTQNCLLLFSDVVVCRPTNTLPHVLLLCEITCKRQPCQYRPHQQNGLLYSSLISLSRSTDSGGYAATRYWRATTRREVLWGWRKLIAGTASSYDAAKSKTRKHPPCSLS
eukprot:3614904-Rhodomonas_salina.1